MSVDIGICSFQKGCTHLYICMKQLLVCIYKKEIFIAYDGIYSKHTKLTAEWTLWTSVLLCCL